MKHIPIVILGGGIAGLSTAFALEKLCPGAYQAFERNNEPGGIASSFQIGDFVFDWGIHGLYTKNEKVLQNMSELISGQHRNFGISIMDYWKGVWARHPVYFNLVDLPDEIAAECLIDFLKNEVGHKQNFEGTFEKWCLSQLGTRISESFIFPYIRKFWTVEPYELTSDWMGERTKVPTVEQIVRGAILKNPPNLHYVKSIFYPVEGGFGRYVTQLAKQVNIALNAEVIRLDPVSKVLEFKDGQHISYDIVISTLPSPTLSQMVKDVPTRIIEAAAKLRATSLAVVSLGICRPDVLKYHWVYVHDPEISFARLSSPNLWSNTNSPKQTSSLQAEVYFRHSPLDSDLLLQRVINELTEMKILHASDEIVVKDVRYQPYANIIYDLHRREALQEIHRFLDESEILFCGRYGFWDYSLIDEVIVEAEKLAYSGYKRIAG